MRNSSAATVLAIFALCYANVAAEQPVGSIWRYTTTAPAEDWKKSEFDDGQ